MKFRRYNVEATYGGAIPADVDRIYQTLVGAAMVVGATTGELADLIEEMDDHKGELTVTWKTSPRRWEKEAIANAWERLANELAMNVHHKVI